MPADELMDRMTMVELMEHLADDQIEPWGPVRADIHAGQISAAIYNAHGVRKKPFTVKDMTIRWEAPEQTMRRSIANLRAWAAQNGIRPVDNG